MPDERIAEFAAEVSGVVRGRAVQGEATLRLGERGLAILVDKGELRLPFGRLEGWVLEGEVLSLRITGGDAIAVRTSRSARALTDALASHACVLPELTRGLRALGSSRARADAAQSALFAPLLAARRRAARLRVPDDRVRALDADVLGREFESAVRAITASRVRQPGPERRALAAAVDDAVHPVRVALMTLGAAAESYARAPESRRLSAWREWTDAARRAFAAADASWPAVRRELQGAYQPQGRWRRWIGSGR